MTDRSLPPEFEAILSQLSPTDRAEAEALLYRARSADEFATLLLANPRLMGVMNEALMANQGNTTSMLEREAYALHNEDLRVLQQPSAEHLRARAAAWEAFLQRPSLAARPDLAADARGQLAVMYLSLYDLTQDEAAAQHGEAILQELLTIYSATETENLPHLLNTHRNLATLNMKRYALSNDSRHFEAADGHLIAMRDLGEGDFQRFAVQARLDLYTARAEREESPENRTALARVLLEALEAHRPNLSRREWLTTLLETSQKLLEEGLVQAVIVFAEKLLPELTPSDGTLWRDAYFVAACAFCQAALLHEQHSYFETARASFEAILPHYNPETDFEQWRLVHTLLIELYVRREQGGRAANVQRALAYAEQLRAHVPPTAPSYVLVLNALCQIHATLSILAEAGTHSELGILYGTQALAGLDEDELPEARLLAAAVRQNIAACYLYRPTGAPLDNLQQAEGYLERAAQIFQEFEDALRWAEVQHGLGTIAFRMAELTNAPTHLEKARTSLKAAADVFERLGVASRLSMTLSALGIVLRMMDAEPQFIVAHLQEALDYYDRAVRLIDAAAEPFAFGINRLGAGNIHLDLYFHNQNDTHLRRAYGEYFRAAEAFFDYPLMGQRVNANIATIHFLEGAWAKALARYRQIIAQGIVDLRASYSEAGQRGVIAEVAEIYGRAAYCLLSLETPEVAEAFQVFEMGKTQLFNQALSLANLDLSTLSDEHTALRDHIETLRAEIDQQEAFLRQAQITPQIESVAIQEAFEQLMALRQALKAHLDELGALSPTAFPQAPSLEAILSAIPSGSVLIAPLVTVVGGKCFIIPSGTTQLSEQHIIDLPELSDVALWQQLGTRPLPTDQTTWLQSLQAYKSGGLGQLVWRGASQRILAWLWRVLVNPICASLQGLPHKNLLILPSAGLQLLPIHAAYDPDTNTFFGDLFEIGYVPSAYALTLLKQRREAPRTAQNAFVGGVADYDQHTGLRDLPNVATEIALVAALTNSTPHLDAAFTREAIKAAAQSADWLHFACHGGFAWDRDPLATALYLHDGQPFTLAEMLSSLKLANAPHITLSACETGLISTAQAPDEFVGLPTGLLQVGARSVLSSLWEVNDLVAALTVVRFSYLVRHQSLSPIAALAHTQRWLRLSTKAALLDTLHSQLEQAASPTLSNAYHSLIQSLEQYAVPNEGVPFSALEHWAAFTYNGI
jgi:CHAT domain-containing protein